MARESAGLQDEKAKGHGVGGGGGKEQETIESGEVAEARADPTIQGLTKGKGEHWNMEMGLGGTDQRGRVHAGCHSAEVLLRCMEM